MAALLIETCTERGMVALLEGGEVVVKRELPFGFPNSKYLMPALEELMQEGPNLDYIAVGVGPGSYTGIRLGAIVGKTWAYARGIPLVGVPTLKGFVPEQEGPFAAIIDAKMSGAYLLQGKKDANGISYTGESVVCPADQLQEQLGLETHLITPNGKFLKEKLNLVNPWIEAAPSPDHMGHIAHALFEEGQFSTDGSLDLLYMRKTQAELQRFPQNP